MTALGRPDVCLTICGSGNPPADLLRLVSEHSWCVLRPGLSDDDLARELAAADLFVLATQTRSGRGSVGEGFGLVLLEAQAAGTPVIAPAYGGSHEAYVEGVTGVAPADESAEALTRTLDDLLKDPARLAWMGGHAAQWTRQAFAPEHYAQLAVQEAPVTPQVTVDAAGGRLRELASALPAARHRAPGGPHGRLQRRLGRSGRPGRHYRRTGPGPDMRGEYAAVTAWFGVAYMVGGMGQPAALCFHVAHDPGNARGYVATSRAMMLVTGTAMLAGGILLAPLLAQRERGADRCLPDPGPLAPSSRQPTNPVLPCGRGGRARATRPGCAPAPTPSLGGTWALATLNTWLARGRETWHDRPCSPAEPIPWPWRRDRALRGDGGMGLRRRRRRMPAPGPERARRPRPCPAACPGPGHPAGRLEPTRLVVAHRSLLPVAALLARDSAVCGVSVLCYGSEMWGSRWRPRRKLERRLMRGAGVRVVACSNFTAGALMRDCRATVLPPALSREWFDTLAAAAAGSRAVVRGSG